MKDEPAGAGTVGGCSFWNLGIRGHAAFLAVERIRQLMIRRNIDYALAREILDDGNLFTTHTPVPAGFDLFDRELVERYLERYLGTLGLGVDEFMKLGRHDSEEEGEPLNMAVLAIRHALHRNGVSELHGQVSRRLLQDHGAWADWPIDEVPIDRFNGEELEDGDALTIGFARRFATYKRASRRTGLSDQGGRAARTPRPRAAPLRAPRRSAANRKAGAERAEESKGDRRVHERLHGRQYPRSTGGCDRRSRTQRGTDMALRGCERERVVAALELFRARVPKLPGVIA